MSRARRLSFRVVVVALLAIAFVSPVGADGDLAPSATPGAVSAWGFNTYGQLGNGATTINSPTLRPVAGLDSASAVAAGTNFSVALRADGTVWAWGINHVAQLGARTGDTCGAGDTALPCSRTPLRVPGLAGVRAVSAGSRHTLALRADGTVWAWGANGFGQVGTDVADGCTVGGVVLPCSPAPVRVGALERVAAVAGGSRHSLAVGEDGAVWAWGLNEFGQLGVATTEICGGAPCSPRPTRVTGLDDVAAVAAGDDYSLALKKDGTVWAWGLNDAEQLGDGTTTNRGTPAPVAGLAGVRALAAGQSHALAIAADGTVWAWGLNEVGQLGIGSAATTAPPTQIPGLGDVAVVAAGEDHSLAVKDDGSLWAWGFNNVGQLGIATNQVCGAISCSSTPVRVTTITGATAVAGGGRHSLLVAAQGGTPQAATPLSVPNTGGGAGARPHVWPAGIVLGFALLLLLLLPAYFLGRGERRA